MEVKKYALYLILVLMAASCVSKKKVLYLQGNAGGSSSSTFEPVIQPDDMLYINVTSKNEDAVQSFNVAVEKQMSTVASNRFSYLVDKDGNIDFPILGLLKAGGLSRTEFTEMLKIRLKEYVTDPVINLRFLNFKVTMLGEVSNPGRVNVDGDRLTLLEAIAQSGDLTVYGKRENILIVRETNGEKTFNRVDITKASFVNSPFYYLKQNDIVYVEPRKAKIDSTAIGGNVTTIISIVSFVLTTTLILTRL